MHTRRVDINTRMICVSSHHVRRTRHGANPPSYGSRTMYQVSYPGKLRRTIASTRQAPGWTAIHVQLTTCPGCLGICSQQVDTLPYQACTRVVPAEAGFNRAAFLFAAVVIADAMATEYHTLRTGEARVRSLVATPTTSLRLSWSVHSAYS